MSRGVTKCPGCGEPVSPFAAGCAICGTDLEAARAARPARRRPSMPRLGGSGARGSGARGEIDWAHITIAVVLSIAAPPIGLVLSLYWANRRHAMGQPAMVVAMLGAAVIAVGVFLDPMLFWNHLLNL